MPQSPRTSLARLLKATLGDEAGADGPELQGQMDVLMQADAENKLKNKKLYLILDLDETLVFSSRRWATRSLCATSPLTWCYGRGCRTFCR